MVVTRKEKDLARIKMLALHGLSKDAWKRFSDEGYKHYFVVETGFKYNLTDLQASLGIHQLRRVESNRKRREEIWQQYSAAFADLPLTLPAPPEPDTRHAYHLFTILIDQQLSKTNREQFLDLMTARRIGVGVHYLSLPEHPVYQEEFGWRPEDCPTAMRIGRQTVSLPLSAKLTDAEVGRVIEAVRAVLNEKNAIAGKRLPGKYRERPPLRLTPLRKAG
jgi:dTDP-4-amino-4,6-dideoxygalactose transaminase